MGISCPGTDTPRVNLFSNPDISFLGRPTGTETEDNTRTIIENMVREDCSVMILSSTFRLTSCCVSLPLFPSLQCIPCTHQQSYCHVRTLLRVGFCSVTITQKRRPFLICSSILLLAGKNVVLQAANESSTFIPVQRLAPRTQGSVSSPTKHNGAPETVHSPMMHPLMIATTQFFDITSALKGITK